VKPWSYTVKKTKSTPIEISLFFFYILSSLSEEEEERGNSIMNFFNEVTWSMMGVLFRHWLLIGLFIFVLTFSTSPTMTFTSACCCCCCCCSSSCCCCCCCCFSFFLHIIFLLFQCSFHHFSLRKIQISFLHSIIILSFPLLNFHFPPLFQGGGDASLPGHWNAAQEEEEEEE